MTNIDLHTHTTASDGTLSPAKLVAAAAEAGLAAVAVTDHDTVAGLAEALAAGREHGVEVVAGVELSVADGDGSLHILGLFLRERPGPLAEALAYLRERRHGRNRRILDKLAALGIHVPYEEVTALAAGAVGRPHIAQALLGRKVVGSLKEAFTVYLGGRGKAYVPKDKLPLPRAVELLKAEGATVLLAHPYLLGLTSRALARTVGRYRDLGVDGLEAYYSEHSEGQTLEYLALAGRLGLAVSGGTDFHGATKPGISLGVGRGKLAIPYGVLEALKARRREAGLAD